MNQFNFSNHCQVTIVTLPIVNCQLPIVTLSFFVTAYVEHIFIGLGTEVTLACFLFTGKLADTGRVVDVRWALVTGYYS